ncbi:AbrB/MazE/SpoVT family DNA-binding domain-containing protein [Candidatus Curtissbacteria bacterium]|nr:AbrB/MazE/SpoVT family DNA-binding domain-containing protein [Candidatus Curtissbacteria bacterium]
MDVVRFVKSFSKGQITIPKKIRESIGLSSDFWLKVSTDNGKIIAEPIEEEKIRDKQEWKKSLLKMKPVDIDLEEIKRNREEIEDRLKRQNP